jgi:hypothetical protein
MKLAILMEVEVSPTIAETMQRSGFSLTPDGTAMQVKIPNSPPIPQRKTRVLFVEHPSCGIQEIAAKYKQADKASDVSNSG